VLLARVGPLSLSLLGARRLSGALARCGLGCLLLLLLLPPPPLPPGGTLTVLLALVGRLLSHLRGEGAPWLVRGLCTALLGRRGLGPLLPLLPPAAMPASPVSVLLVLLAGRLGAGTGGAQAAALLPIPLSLAQTPPLSLEALCGLVSSASASDARDQASGAHTLCVARKGVNACDSVGGWEY